VRSSTGKGEKRADLHVMIHRGGKWMNGLVAQARAAGKRYERFRTEGKNRCREGRGRQTVASSRQQGRGEKDYVVLYRSGKEKEESPGRGNKSTRSSRRRGCSIYILGGKEGEGEDSRLSILGVTLAPSRRSSPT